MDTKPGQRPEDDPCCPLRQNELLAEPARRTEARHVKHRRAEDRRKCPFRPSFPPIEDPHGQPEAARCEHDPDNCNDDGHAAILTAVAWGTEGRYVTGIQPDSLSGHAGKHAVFRGNLTKSYTALIRSQPKSPVHRVEQTRSTRRKMTFRAGYTFANRCTLSLHGKRQRPGSAGALSGRCEIVMPATLTLDASGRMGWGQISGGDLTFKRIEPA